MRTLGSRAVFCGGLSLAALWCLAPAARAGVPAECAVPFPPRPACHGEGGLVELAVPGEHTAVLVRCAAGARDARPPRAVLAAAGFEVEELRIVGGGDDDHDGGIFLAELAGPLPTALLAERLAALARDPGCLDAASPLYLDGDGARVAALPPVQARLRPGVEDAAITRAAAALGLVPTGSGPGDPAVRSFEPAAAHADPWCLSRRLYETGLVQWSAPERFEIPGG